MSWTDAENTGVHCGKEVYNRGTFRVKNPATCIRAKRRRGGE
jgi:hypothetical protein